VNARAGIITDVPRAFVAIIGAGQSRGTEAIVIGLVADICACGPSSAGITGGDAGAGAAIFLTIAEEAVIAIIRVVIGMCA
jgi:hypothetical protein